MMIEPCLICEAKDAEIRYMTEHIGRLTQMLELKQEYIAALNYQCNLEGNQSVDHHQQHHIIMALRQEILTTRTLMTDEQMKELRELLMKAHRKQQGETK
jgi:hypothetical protein